MTDDTGRPAPLADRYLDTVSDLLAGLREREAAALSRAAGLVAGAVAGGGRLYAHGAGHSALPAQDLVYRAGGLALVNLLSVPGTAGVTTVPAPLGSALEHVGGLAAAVLAAEGVRAGDLLIVISLSGRNALPVEMAREGRARGATVLGVTSLAYRAAGATLPDHCDAVLDTGVPLGDAALTADGVAAPFGPVSTVIACALLQAVVAEAAGRLAAAGTEPPLLRSANVDGGREWNEGVTARHADRIRWR
jgi:uncharacterized phosphosugar-binding protein